MKEPHQVWCSDLTYIRLKQGFVYLVAIMDWYSRYILSWRVSITLHYEFCVEALLEAMEKHGKPEIFNSDQGVQYTSQDFTKILEGKGIKISMDSKGRALDNVFIERFWRSLKQEKIYRVDLETVKDARITIEEYMDFYNNQRMHQALGYQTPRAVHFKGSVKMPMDVMDDKSKDFSTYSQGTTTNKSINNTNYVLTKEDSLSA